jgi:hypothetical protein
MLRKYPKGSIAMNLDLCVERCLEAARSCEEILPYAREAEGSSSDVALLAALSDAARVTALSADRLVRLSDLHGMILQVCTEIAERAALACARHSDDDYIFACGEACAACAAACHALARGEEDAPAQDHEMADIGALLEAGLSERVSEIRYRITQ